MNLTEKIPDLSKKYKKYKYHFEEILDSMSIIHRGDTLKTIGNRTGYTYGMIYKIRRAVITNNDTNIPVDKAIIIADILKISVDDFLKCK